MDTSNGKEKIITTTTTIKVLLIIIHEPDSNASIYFWLHLPDIKATWMQESIEYNYSLWSCTYLNIIIVSFIPVPSPLFPIIKEESIKHQSWLLILMILRWMHALCRFFRHFYQWDKFCDCLIAFLYPSPCGKMVRPIPQKETFSE